MKLFVSTVGEIDARRKAISNEDLTRFLRATTGKNVEIEIPPTASFADLVTGVRGMGDINPHIPISSTVVLKNNAPVKGATLFAAGLTDGSMVKMKFVHKTA